VSVTTASPASASLTDRLDALSRGDRLLCGLLIGFALLALTLGIAYGVAMALARSGAVSFLSDTPYRILTLHGTTAFFYWLYSAQAALLIILAVGETRAGIALRTSAWIGAILIVAGFVLSELSAFEGTPLLYDANPELGIDDPHVVAGMAGGYLLLAAGLVGISISGIATTLIGARASTEGFSALGFGLFALAGFLIVSAIAAVNAFLPNLLWALGYASFREGELLERGVYTNDYVEIGKGDTLKLRTLLAGPKDADQKELPSQNRPKIAAPKSVSML